MKRSSNTLLVAIIGMALFALVFANVALNRVRPKSEAELNQEMADAQAQKAKEKPAAAPENAAPAGDDLVTLSPEKTFGPAGGKPEVTIGFRWTPAVQADPTKVQSAIQMLKQGAPQAQIRVVNLDLAESASVPEGITIDKKSVCPLSPDGSIDQQGVVSAITQLIGHAPPPEMVGGSRPQMMPPGMRAPGMPGGPPGMPGGIPGTPGGPPIPPPAAK